MLAVTPFEPVEEVSGFLELVTSVGWPVFLGIAGWLGIVLLVVYGVRRVLRWVSAVFFSPLDDPAPDWVADKYRQPYP